MNELGLMLELLGAALLGAGAASFLYVARSSPAGPGPRHRELERKLSLAGSILLVTGFAAQLISSW